MRIEVLHIGAKVARTCNAEDSVHVGAVEVDQSTARMDLVSQFAHRSFKHANRVWIGNHEYGDFVVQLLSKVIQIDRATGACLHSDRLESRHHGAGWIGAMRIIWHEHFSPLFAQVAKVRRSDPKRG